MFVQTAHGGFAGAFSACDDSDNRFANEYWNKGRYLPSYLQVTARIFFFHARCGKEETGPWVAAHTHHIPSGSPSRPPSCPWTY